MSATSAPHDTDECMQMGRDVVSFWHIAVARGTDGESRVASEVQDMSSSCTVHFALRSLPQSSLQLMTNDRAHVARSEESLFTIASMSDERLTTLFLDKDAGVHAPDTLHQSNEEQLA